MEWTTRRTRIAFLAVVAASILAGLGVNAQTYEGLENPSLEGPAVETNGFQLSYDPGVQIDVGCPTTPAPPPMAGIVRTGSCAVNLGHPDPDRTTSWAAVSAIKAIPSAFGNQLSNMAGISAWHNVPNGAPSVEGARYQFYYRIDITGDTVAEACIVQDAGMPLVPVSPAATAGWQQITFSSTDPSITFRDTDTECSNCLSGCASMTQSDMQAKYPTARILAIYIQLVHQNWAPSPNPMDPSYPPWQPGYPVYLDDLSLTMNSGPGVLVDVGTGVEVDEEGPTTDTYQIVLSGAPASGETVTVTPAEDPGAGNPAQVSIAPASVQFTAADWNSPKTVWVTAVDDALAEAWPHFTDITHTVTSSSALSPYATTTVPTFVVTVNDNDLAGVNPDPAEISLSEATPAVTTTFDVKLGSPPQPGETVTVTLTPDAQQDVDTDLGMLGFQNTLTFTALDPPSKPVTVFVVDDTTDEAHPHGGKITGTVTTDVPGSAYDGVTFGDGGSGVDVSIDDNDPDVTVAGVTAAEEDGVIVGKFTLTRGPDTTNAVTVAYTLSGTATSGSDYAAPSGTVVIPAGAATADVFVTPIDDGVDEVTETISLTLDTASVPYTAGGASAIASIDLLDNDDPTISVSATDASAAETGPSTGEFTLTRANTDLAIDVDYTLGGTATDVTDYAVDDASPVHFNAGEASRTVKLTPVDDALDEVAETATLTISAGTGYVVGAGSSATVTITDNDLPEISVTAATPTADEAGPTSGKFTLTRTAGDTSSALVVKFTVSGGATSASDYAGLGTSATIPALATSVDLVVTPVDDTVVELSETVVLTLDADAAYAVAASPDNTATVTIADNDYVVTVAATSASASEVGPVAGVFTLTRDKTGHAMVVNIWISGTATSGTDYPTAPSTVSFAAADLTATYSPLPTVDAIDEAAETIIMDLAAGTGYTLGLTNSATVTIGDGNVPVAVADGYSAYLACTLSVPALGLMANDPVPTGASYTAVPWSGASAQGGAATVFASGAFTYTPPAGYTGPDSFLYKINDGTFDSSAQTVSLTVSINTVGVASFVYSPGAPRVGQTVVFFDRTADAESGTASSTWDFGDGFTATGRSVSHAYNAAGTYSIRLIVQDGECSTAQVVQSIAVTMAGAQPPQPTDDGSDDEDTETPTGGDDKPFLKAETLESQTAREMTGVTLYGFASGSATGPMSFHWEQLGGPAVTLSNANAAWPTFTAPLATDGMAVDLYFVLDVKQGSTQAAPVVAKVTVTSANAAPTLKASATDAAPGSQAMLVAEADDENGDALTMTWTQIGGPRATLSSAEAPQASFAMPDAPAGTVLVFAVEVFDGRVSALAQVHATVLAPPVPPRFAADVGSDGSVTFTPTTPAAGFLWDFGDASPTVDLASDGTATHKYAKPGTYTVRLTATAADGTQLAAADAVDVAFQSADGRSRPATDASSQTSALPATIGAVLILGALLAILVVLVVSSRRRRARQPTNP